MPPKAKWPQEPRRSPGPIAPSSAHRTVRHIQSRAGCVSVKRFVFGEKHSVYSSRAIWIRNVTMATDAEGHRKHPIKHQLRPYLGLRCLYPHEIRRSSRPWSVEPHTRSTAPWVFVRGREVAPKVKCSRGRRRRNSGPIVTKSQRNVRRWPP